MKKLLVSLVCFILTFSLCGCGNFTLDTAALEADVIENVKFDAPLEKIDNENTINVSIEGNELTIKGELDKNIRGAEKIINFAQTYYLDEKINKDDIKKERKGNKYIITIPFEN